jgi:hypothetical protein
MKDARSKTNQANLGKHVPTALDPTSDSRTVALQISPALYTKLTNKAENHGKTMSAYLRYLLRHRPLFDR